MSKLSVKPDNQQAAPLRPTAFPDLSNFKMSSTSSQSNSAVRPFQELDNLKFSSRAQILPNLFQYNDRSRLTFSSDEEDQQQLINTKKEVKTSDIGDFQNGAYPKNSRKIELHEVKEEQQIQSPKFIHSTEQKRSLAEIKDEEMTIKKQEKNEERGIVEEQLFLSQTYEIGRKGSNKKRLPAHNKPEQQQIKQQIFSSKPAREKEVVSPAAIAIAEKKKTHYWQNEIPQTKVDKQDPSNSFLKNQNQKYEQKAINQREQSRHQIDEADISHTDAILERIKPEEKPLLIRLESDKNLEQINQCSKQPAQALALTPRKRRNKIFDQSIKRDHSYLSSHKKSVTPSKEVQTESRHMMKQSRNQSRSRITHTPQVKALNILDKLVDQIGDKNYCNRSISYSEEDSLNIDPFPALSEFIRICTEEISRSESITQIETIGELGCFKRVDAIYRKALNLRQKIAPTILQLSLASSGEAQLIKKFQKLTDSIEKIYHVSVGYRKTSERLFLIQKRLEQYVLIMQEKDSKRLYGLIRDLNSVIDGMKQLRAGCGGQKIEQMFSQYLFREIGLLEEIKGDIDNNFIDDFPQLAF